MPVSVWGLHRNFAGIKPKESFIARTAQSFTLIPARPYSLQRTAERLVRFDDALDRYDFENATVLRLLTAGHRLILVRVRQLGPPSRARLRVSIVGSSTREARAIARSYARIALGAGAPVAAFYRASRSDPMLGPALKRFAGLRVAGSPSLFEALVTAILSQQINLRFAYALRRELVHRYGRSVCFGGEQYWAFPSARRLAEVPVSALRELRISQSKARAILAAARALRAGAPAQARLEALTDDALVERLVSLHGVGRWTAEVALMRGLARPDVFPAADLVVVKYLSRELLGRTGGSTEQEMRSYSERWRPHRALALTYLYAELAARRRA